MTTPSANANVAAVKKTCPKCGYIRETAETRCPDCGKVLQSVTRIRVLGVISVILGTFLLLIMGYLSFWAYRAINEPVKPGSTPRFTGGPQELGFIIFVFGLVMMISLISLLGGLWMIIF